MTTAAIRKTMGKTISSVFTAIFARSHISSEFPQIETKNTAVISPDAIKNRRTGGFSLIELLIAMTITLVLLGITSVSFSRALSTRDRESSRTDALTAAQAAINVMSREISNSGYGLTNNGIVLADSGSQKLHIRANTKNDNSLTTDADEDVTYYYDAASQSIVRYDANATPSTSGIINQISRVTFRYFDYTDSNSTPVVSSTPTADTGRVRITLTVIMADVVGQPVDQTVTFTSDVTLRNSTYMLNQY